VLTTHPNGHLCKYLNKKENQVLKQCGFSIWGLIQGAIGACERFCERCSWALVRCCGDYDFAVIDVNSRCGMTCGNGRRQSCGTNCCMLVPAVLKGFCNICNSSLCPLNDWLYSNLSNTSPFDTLSQNDARKDTWSN
jgi:hypothetical protein